MEPCKCTPQAKAVVKDNDDKMTGREKMLSELKQNAFYDTKKACEILGVSQQSLRRAIAAGKIKPVRVGHYLRIPVTEIEKLTNGEVALISTQEAADLLSVSLHMIRSLIKSGKINAFRLAKSGPLKIPKSEIDRIYREGIPQ